MADQACATDATAAGLAGQFRAFIADAAGGPELRVPLGEPWHRVDGIPWASYDQLSATSPTLLDTFMTVKADGSLWSGSPTWVGTAANCSLWTTTSGTGTAGDPGASQLSDVRDVPGVWTCTSSFPVICLQE